MLAKAHRRAAERRQPTEEKRCVLRNLSSCTGCSISSPGTRDMPIVDDIVGLRRILTRSRTIAVVGLSANWYRPSYFAAKYMRDHDYRVIPVNPTYDEVMGERCYPDLPSANEGAAVPIDIVDCFRQPSEIPPIARDAIAIGAKVLWMQLGIRNDEAAQLASDAGLDVVMNRCVKIEHARLMGGLNWAGVNTGVISARRPV
jgi:predicted CoA-binding protein